MKLKKKNTDIAVLLLVASLVILFSFTLFGQELKHVVLVKTMPIPVINKQCEWFEKQLKELGYYRGENLDLVIFDAKGDRAQAENFLRERLKISNPDIVVTSATLASQSAAKILKGTGIPIVFFTVSDPVGAGLVPKIGFPSGKNITGKVHIINRETRVNLVMKLVGSAKTKKPIRFGFISSTYPSAIGDLRELEIISRQRDDVKFISYQVPYKKVPEGLSEMLEGVQKAIALLKDKVDYWWEPSSPLGEMEAYSQLLLNESSVPIVMGTKLASVKLGALMHLTPSTEYSGREAALIVDAVLKGSDPGKIPVTPPSSFDLGINLTTALKLKIVVPPDMLNLAGDNIFR